MTRTIVAAALLVVSGLHHTPLLADDVFPGKAWAKAIPAEVGLDVDLPPNATYDVAWWNPANDRNGSFQDKANVSDGTKRFTAPDSGDWALRIVAKETQ